MAGSLGRDESEAALVHFLDQELVVDDELLALEKSLDNQLKEKKPSGKRTSRDNCQVLKYGPKGRVYSGSVLPRYLKACRADMPSFLPSFYRSVHLWAFRVYFRRTNDANAQT